MKKKWQTVSYTDPESGMPATITSSANCCPNCGQSRCTKNNPTCLAVQDAIKRGLRTFFFM